MILFKDCGDDYIPSDCSYSESETRCSAKHAALQSIYGRVTWNMQYSILGNCDMKYAAFQSI